ncbi:uncharacterized protein I303_108399 [Kwoniella dejecticola CBS 10117]|uniref:Uncharacterized protein n=1 Tax=Kwoniella dejecticola CBS 10117 TaxID=1296121 RepID=A0A1A5ZXI4_9TREE|nr:uncharacterized protein I303_07274 [Kwoniella dejecticola CBS 10117]OBR82514.1 hypothetical protein I303_07274 [Kwoniella dejecticola CBS 10117]
MPNWVTDTDNSTSNSTAPATAGNHEKAPNAHFQGNATARTDVFSAFSPATNVAKPAQSAANRLPVITASNEPRKESPIILSPDTPPQSALPQVPDPLPVLMLKSNSAQASSSGASNQNARPQQQANEAHHLKHPTPQRSVNTGVLQDGFKAYVGATPQQAAQVSYSSPSISTIKANSNSSVAATTSGVRVVAQMSPAIPFQFVIQGNQVATFSIHPEYAQRNFRFISKDKSSRQLTTLDILNLASPSLNASDMDQAIKDPAFLINLGKRLVDAANTRDPLLQSPQINSLREQQLQGSSQTSHSNPPQPAQAGPSRPTAFVASNGYSYISKETIPQSHRAIDDIQQSQLLNQPDGRQTFVENTRTTSAGTPVQSPSIAIPHPAGPPELQAILQGLAKEQQNLEQRFGRAWEEWNTAQSTSRNGIIELFRRFAQSSEEVNKLKAALVEERNKLLTSQASVLRLTESETNIRTELQEVKRKLRSEVDARKEHDETHGKEEIENRLRTEIQEAQKALHAETVEKTKAQAANSTELVQLSQCTNELQRVKTQQSNDLTTYNEKIITLEKEQNEKIKQLTAQHDQQVEKLEKELHEASKPVFGVHATTSPRLSKSPADPAVESAKLRSLLKAKNEKFAELKVESDNKIAELEAQLSMASQESKANRAKLQSQNASTVERLEKKIRELEKDKSQLATPARAPNPDQEMTVALTRILNWCESLQKSLIRTTSISNETDTSATASPVLTPVRPPADTAAPNEAVPRKLLLDRANEFIRDMKATATTVLSRKKEREEKVKKLQGQVELLRVELNAAQTSQLSSNTSDEACSDLDDVTKAFNKIVTWGKNIQSLMGRRTDRPLETMKPLETADQFRKEMHAIFEEMQSKGKAQNRLIEEYEKSTSTLKSKLDDKEKQLQANLQALLSKTTQYDETANVLKVTYKLLEDTKQMLKDVQAQLDAAQTQAKDRQNGLIAVKTKLIATDETIGKLEQTIVEKDEALAKKDRDLRKKEEEIKKKDEEMTEKNEVIANKNEEIKKKDAELEVVREAIKRHQEDLDSKEQELEVMRRDIKLKEESLQGKDEEMEDVRRYMRSKEEEVKSKEEEVRNTKAELRAKCKECEEKCKALQLMLDEDRAEAQMDLDTGRKETREMLKGQKKIIAEKEGLQAEKDELLGQLSERREEIKELKKEIEEKQATVDNAETQIREAMDKQFEQREGYVAAENELKSQRDQLKEAIKKLEEELKTLKQNSPKIKAELVFRPSAPNRHSPSSSLGRPVARNQQIINSNGKRPSSQLSTSTPASKIAERSASPDILLFDSQPPHTPRQGLPTSSQPGHRNLSNTPLFFNNEESTDRSISQTPDTPGLSQSVQGLRPKKRQKRIIDGEHDEGTPAPEVRAIPKAASVTPSVAGSAYSVLSYKPVSDDWVKQNIGLCLHRSHGKVRCKLCFVAEKRAETPRKQDMKLEDMEPLPAGLSEDELLGHLKTHGATLRRLKIKRVREGKEEASPEPE